MKGDNNTATNDKAAARQRQAEIPKEGEIMLQQSAAFSMPECCIIFSAECCIIIRLCNRKNCTFLNGELCYNISGWGGSI